MDEGQDKVTGTVGESDALKGAEQTQPNAAAEDSTATNGPGPHDEPAPAKQGDGIDDADARPGTQPPVDGAKAKDDGAKVESTTDEPSPLNVIPDGSKPADSNVILQNVIK